MDIGANRTRGWAWACLVAILAACTDAGTTTPPSASPSIEPSVLPVVAEVTLTDDGCTSTPRVAPPLDDGMTQFTLQNASSGPGVFELVRIAKTFEEFDQFLVDARERIDAGQPPPGELPNILQEIVRERLDSDTSREHAVHLTDGTYAVVCVVVTESDDIVTVYAVGPYVVTD